MAQLLHLRTVILFWTSVFRKYVDQLQCHHNSKIVHLMWSKQLGIYQTKQCLLRNAVYFHLCLIINKDRNPGCAGGQHKLKNNNITKQCLLQNAVYFHVRLIINEDRKPGCAGRQHKLKNN